LEQLRDKEIAAPLQDINHLHKGDKQTAVGQNTINWKDKTAQ
jgi:hypothetical protein